MSTALTQVDAHFALLVYQPAPLAFDGRGIAGLPDRILPRWTAARMHRHLARPRCG